MRCAITTGRASGRAVGASGGDIFEQWMIGPVQAREVRA